MAYDETAAKEKLYTEIEDYAEMQMAKGLKSKYAPKPAPEAPATAPGPSEDELDAEALERLTLLAGE